MKTNKKKLTNLGFKTRTEYWKSDECKQRAMTVTLLTQNMKLALSASEDVIVCGLEFMPMFKKACKWAGTCAKTCLEGSGVAQVMKKHSPYITAVDKCRLSRQWLFINRREVFDDRLKREITQQYEKAQGQHKKLCIRLDTLSEYKLRDVYAPQFPDVIFYDYFKEPERVGKPRTKNIMEMYSWNEKSTSSLIDDAKAQGKPIAVVLPRAQHKELFSEFPKDKGLRMLKHKGIYIVDGDRSDLHAYSYSRKGRLVVSALKEKQTRYGMQDTTFLSSWETFFELSNLNDLNKKAEA